MNLLEKIKVLLRLNKTSKTVVEEVTKVKEASKKNGIRSSEFYLAILLSLSSILAAAAGALPPLYAAIAVTASAVSYTLSRGITKQSDLAGGDKPGYKTSEFYIGLASDLGALLAAAAGAVSPETSAILITASRVAYAVSRGLAKQ